MEAVFRTNVVGTIRVTNTVMPLVAGGTNQPLVVNLSSQLGSIANNVPGGAQGRSGGVASYRIARAAANMATRTFAAECAGRATFLALSPGHVATDMGSAGGRAAPLTVLQSVECMVAVMAAAATDASMSGGFYGHDGAELPW